MTQRVFNFSPGPAVLPEQVLAEAQRDLMALPGVGMSVLEISHRSKPYAEIQAAAEANLRTLLDIGENFRILFLQGGSRLQFSMVPMNLLGSAAVKHNAAAENDAAADYIVTGSWGQKALAEARREGNIRAAFDAGDSNYDRVPAAADMQLTPDAAYVHFTSNETIQGVQFDTEPPTGDVPLVCDASSDFLSRPLAMDRYGLIYACAQKNTGPAGVTVVIIRDDLVERSPPDLPGMLSYRNHVEGGSCYNTPPVFGVYIVKLVTDWLLGTVGGLRAMHQQNQAKAQQLYAAIDGSGGFYAGHARGECRSLMNVTFRLPDAPREAKFVDEARQRGLCELKGHRSVGGIRASIYNAMPPAGVAALADFMREFQRANAE